MSRPGFWPSNAGFTLLEVLVAMAVAALVISAISQLTRMMINVEQRVERQQVAHESLMGAAQVFRDVVAQAVPDLRYQAESSAPVGSPDKLTLLSRGPSVMTLDRPVPMTFRVETRTGGSALVLSWRDPVSDTDREEVLIRNARSITLSYFGSGKVNGQAWHGYWDRPLRLPKAALLRVEFAELGAPLDIIGRTRSELPYACIASPHESRCRHGVEQ